MGGRVKFALHGSSIDRSRASALSPDAGKLSHAASSIARGDLLFRRLDYRDQALSTLRGKIRSLQSDLSRVGVNYRTAHLDVFDLFAPASRRAIKPDSPPGTRTQSREDRAG